MLEYVHLLQIGNGDPMEVLVERLRLHLEAQGRCFVRVHYSIANLRLVDRLDGSLSSDGAKFLLFCVLELRQPRSLLRQVVLAVDGQRQIVASEAALLTSSAHAPWPVVGGLLLRLDLNSKVHFEVTGIASHGV